MLAIVAGCSATLTSPLSPSIYSMHKISRRVLVKIRTRWISLHLQGSRSPTSNRYTAGPLSQVPQLPRLAIHLVLMADFGRFVALIAMVCMSFVAINKGTNKRGLLTPSGTEERKYVAAGNCMLERLLCCKYEYRGP